MASENHVENPIEYVLEKASWNLAAVGRALTRAPLRRSPETCRPATGRTTVTAPERTQQR